MSEDDGRSWFGRAELAKTEEEKHGAPSAEEIHVESDRTGTLIAEDSQEELTEAVQSGRK